MQRKRDGLVPIGEAISGPVKAIREASPQALHHFTQADQVNQLVGGPAKRTPISDLWSGCWRCAPFPAPTPATGFFTNASTARTGSTGSATCWIKMSEVTTEGLRQAFLDPGSRILLNPREGKLEPEEHAELVALAWEGGFLDGAAIHFNKNLNVLVGGRGTGKSTVIESIRTVLGLEAIGDEARRAHEGIIRHVLKNGTKISLLVRAQRPAVREYRIERTIPNPPLVREPLHRSHRPRSAAQNHCWDARAQRHRAGPHRRG